MFNIIIAVHVCLCVILIGLVLLQQGKGAEAGAIMGGGSNSLLGAGSAGDFMSKFTTGIAIAFMVTSIMLVKSYNTVTPLNREAFNPLEGSVIPQAKPEVQAPVAAVKEQPQSPFVDEVEEKKVVDTVQAAEADAKVAVKEMETEATK